MSVKQVDNKRGGGTPETLSPGQVVHQFVDELAQHEFGGAIEIILHHGKIRGVFHVKHVRRPISELLEELKGGKNG
jgi:hypothetical protein